MKIWNVYHHTKLNKYVAVKVGFSYTGLLFGILWFLWNKLWLLAGGYILAMLALSFMEELGQHTDEVMITSFIIQLAIAFYIAYNGNSWKMDNLENRGFDKVGDSIAAKNKEHAISKVEG